jgi:ABC-type transport system involved in multi-copper enzyme maturation permease subunit
MTTTPRPIPSAAETIRVMAALTFKRLLRGRLVWFVGIAAGLPSLIGLAMRGSTESPASIARATLITLEVLFAILVPLLVGSAIGDELGSKTATYLWSRPMPRWTILVGKLIILAPITAAILAGAWLVALLFGGALISGQAIAAVFVGVLAVSVMVASIATIGPRHGIAFSMMYVLIIDLGLDTIPAAVRQLSMIHQTTVLANLPDGPEGSPLEAAVWLAAMATIWLVVALRSLRTREA